MTCFKFEIMSRNYYTTSELSKMSTFNIPANIRKFSGFDKISDNIDALFQNKNLFNELLQFVLEQKFPPIPVRKNQIVFNYAKDQDAVYQEVERTTEDESRNPGGRGGYASKFSKDYLEYHMNSIVSEEKEMRLTTYDLAALDNYYNASLKGKRYGFLPLTIHSRDSPNANPHYLLIILDYKSGKIDPKTKKVVSPDKFYLFDSRNSNDYLYRSKYLPSNALDQLMFGLIQYKPFSEFEYVPTGAWLGEQLQTVVHRNKWDSIYSLAWCLLVAMWLDASDEVNPETLMIELNNSALELDKQNFIHEFARSVLTEYRDYIMFGKPKLPASIKYRGHEYVDSKSSLRQMTEEEHKAARPEFWKNNDERARLETKKTDTPRQLTKQTPPQSPRAETDLLIEEETPQGKNCLIM